MKWVVLLVVWAAPVWGHHAGEQYIPLFRKATERYWGDTPHTWHLMRELARAESSFRSMVRSHAGAVGLTQVLPATWREIRDRGIQDLGGDLTDPSDNVRAGTYYLRTQYNIWSPDRPERDRVLLALACYNAGAGNLLRAQRRAGGSLKFDDIAQRLPDVTGSHAAGTIQYSHKIYDGYRAAQAAAPQEEDEPVEIADRTVAPVAPPTEVVVRVEVGLGQTGLPLNLSWDTFVHVLFAIMQLTPRGEQEEEEDETT